MTTDTKKAPSGFEPLYGESADEEGVGREPIAGDAPELPAELQRVVERILRRERERR